MLAATLSYRVVASDLPRALDRAAQAPQAAREIAYYREKIGSIGSIEAFLADDRLFSFAMKAHGLGDMAFAKGFMRKALEEGISRPDSFANRLADKRYREFVAAFDFARHGDSATIYPAAVQGTIDKYVRQTLEEQEGARNEGVRLALYFERKAGAIRNPYDILADRALGQVVRTALGLPDEIAASDIDRQARLLEDRLDFADFKDPVKLDAFLQRFTALWDAKMQPAAVATAPALLFGPPASAQIGSDVLLSLQSLRIGR